MNKVYLIGLPASGKTTTAKWLAEKLGWECLDLDDLISQETSLTIPQYFEQFGESKFRELESSLLKNTKKLSHVVISCGGGTAAYFNNMDWMCANGMTIYLNTDLTTILSRIEKNIAQRPMFLGLSADEIKEKLLTILEERAIFYSKSKIIWNKAVPTDMLHFAVNQFIAM
jgi:shikimate kinase